jgi:phosphohistidine phosphatase
MSKQLVVLRHAKAEHGDTSDHDRPLTARGRRDALAAGRWLAERDLRPDLTVCSTATRATQTWALVATELGDDIPTSFDHGVYENDLDRLLGLVRDTPEEVDTLLMVGHNPTFQELVLALASDGATEDLFAARHDFGTAAVAVLSVPRHWSVLDQGAATLTGFTVARG